MPQSAYGAEQPAEEISGNSIVVSRKGMAYPEWLFNGDIINWQTCKAGMSMTLSHEKGIGSVALIFNRCCGEYTVINEDTGEKAICGRNGFLHDFVDAAELFGTAPETLTILFGDTPPQITEMRVFTPGEPPADVQRWKLAPEEGVDLLVFPTHGDDEQLFFAGLLPYYAGEKGYETQVVYSTDHGVYGPTRPHEMLNGLWAVGVKNYPVFGPFPDYMSKTEEQAVEALMPDGITEEDVKSFVVENIRRYKPQVIVGHDLNGEYGHGFHQLYGRMVKEAVEISADASSFPESARKYGVWDVPKTYLHLYGENTVHMDWDVPLEHFGGMTAYQVTKELGFPAHKSQQAGFSWYFAGHDTAESITENGPCNYGLVRTTVGADVRKDDLFENLKADPVQTIPEETAASEETSEPEGTAAPSEEPAEQREQETQKPSEPPIEPLSPEAQAADRKLADEILLRERQHRRNILMVTAAGLCILAAGAVVILKIRK